ncbi:hypothetical protein NO1_1580 [Candidatus Termititenax aidoneus]|uniref:Uncharacterized protein n=1 Tax=Termititenax aidoneus TaxID=2218524 RepID=A0A388TDA9_TERA1|nr:hypothetical protein NO1_1580 [Candidatus Termititenax aidoneus]
MFGKTISATETKTKTQQAAYSSQQVDGNTLIKLRNPDGRIIAGRLYKNPDGGKTILALGGQPLYYAGPAGQNGVYQWFKIDPFSGQKETLQNILALHNFDLTRIALLDTDPETFSDECAFVSARELTALTKRQEESLFAALLDLGKHFVGRFF